MAQVYTKGMRKLLFLVLAIFPALVLGADIAYVVADRAVIYSDMELSVPIGYARKGKKIKVGEVARVGGTILTTVVSGRLTYIRRADVELEKNLANQGGIHLSPQVQEHEVLFETHTFEDDFALNNHLVLLAGSSDGGQAWQELAQSQESGKLSHVGVALEHRAPLRRNSWSIGLQYMSSELGDYDFKTVFLEGRLQYSLVRFDWLALDVVGGLNGSAEARLTNHAQKEKSRGIMYGWLAGAQVKLFPFSKIGVIAGAEMRRYYLSEMEELTSASGASTSLEGFDGTYFWAGITWKL